MKFVFQKLKFLRVSTWWTHKLPPLFGIAYYFTLVTGLSIETAVLRFVILIPCMIGAAGFGHYINDLFDIEVDRVARKGNAAEKHSILRRTVTVILLLALALVPWFIFYEFDLIHQLVMAVLVLFVLYSVAPVRLKDRGLMGVIADTLYAHAIPGAIIALAMVDGMVQHENVIVLLWLTFVWQFAVGFRNIVNHQLEDFEHDAISKTKTWVQRIGKDWAKKICIYFIHPVELILFITLVVMLWQSVLAVVVLVVMSLYRFYLYKYVYEKGYLSSLRNYFSFVNNSYEEDVPIAMLVGLVVIQPLFVLVMIVYLILFPQYVLRNLNR